MKENEYKFFQINYKIYTKDRVGNRSENLLNYYVLHYKFLIGGEY